MSRRQKPSGQEMWPIAEYAATLAAATLGPVAAIMRTRPPAASKRPEAIWVAASKIKAPGTPAAALQSTYGRPQFRLLQVAAPPSPRRRRNHLGSGALGRVDKVRRGDFPDTVQCDLKLIFLVETGGGSRPSEQRRVGVF